MNNRTKIVQVIAVVVIVVVIIVAAVMIFRRSGRSDLVKAVQELAQAQTLHARSELKIQQPLLLRDKERPFTTMNIKVEGDVAKNEEIPELTGTLYMEARGRGNVFFADGDVRLLKDAVAFRLENLPVLLNPSGSLVKKWTYVSVPAFVDNKPTDIEAITQNIVQKLSYAGKDDIEGKSTMHFTGTVTAEEEQILHDLLEQKKSGSRALHIIARLLNGADVQSIDIWVDKGSHEIPRLTVKFVKLGADNQVADFATLELAFTDYGKNVTIDRPNTEVTVKPEVFSKLFGTGQIVQE